ncbi:MAG: acyl-CoA dehydrogenase family protein [Gammaproteobacteria bacterium]|jgi:acyl-CoA dehydrogenase|nr:acyl-CoA dehydrogenase family protein [Gammaproteobacteria bacterium]MBP6051675.1 acyl-CoA dehydrogenase family protein [Pseudomonadales bacterium]MBK6584684.1 acyl-CoA dehydrogenase family protein [Gammaproteobacteria bacterium]MBK7171017.1 acyl-CoA dehydrogenase family protein [Gammaproteobacteria bacterium]MBK7519807.1 acyl-CoA dehydrogenase family protein [Gammaproteobacteria bacterium]
MSWDFSTEPEFAAELAWIREYIDSRILALEIAGEGLNQRQLDALWQPFKDEVRARGLWAPHLPPEHGGSGMGQVRLALMHEVLGRSTLAPEIFGCQAPDSGNAELLAAGANEAQRKRWLEPLLAGRVRSSFALTEPHNSGSDPTGITTRCEREADEWVLNGHKWFASNASVSDFMIVMAVTDPAAPAHRRAAMLVVPCRHPGVRLLRDAGSMHHPTGGAPGELLERIGGHTEVVFENCRVPLDHMIGAPGDGFVLAQKRLGGGRIHHAMRCIGQAGRAFEMMCERAVSRSTRGKPLGKQQMIQDMIAESCAELEMNRLLVLHAAWTMDQAGDHSELARQQIAMVKFVVPRTLLGIIDRAIQVHGALGYTTDMPLEEMYRLARALRIADGADEVHKQTVARAVLTHVTAVSEPSEYLPTRRRRAAELYGERVAAIRATIA